MLVRSTLSEGHSHVWSLPAEKPAERAVFFSETEDGEHEHALIYGGDRGMGNIESETSGSDTSYVFSEDGDTQELRRGDVSPEQPDPRRIHSHIVPVLR